MHQLVLENALVVPGLSHNLTSHKQFIENGHMVFFHKDKTGFVLNKEPKFKVDDIIIPFVTDENGLHYREEVIPEETVAAMVAQRTQKLTNATCAYTAVSYLSVADETLIQGSYRYSQMKGLDVSMVLDVIAVWKPN